MWYTPEIGLLTNRQPLLKEVSMFGSGGPVIDGFFAAASTVLALLALFWHWSFRKGVHGSAGQWNATLANL